MNIYNESFIKENFNIISINYAIKKDGHSESFYMEYEGGKSGKKKSKHYFSHNDPLFFAWMKVLDYDTPASESGTDIFSTLNRTGELLPLHAEDSSVISDFLNSLSSESLSELTKELFTILKNAINKRVALCIFYPYYYKVFQDMYNYIDAQSEAPDFVLHFTAHLTELAKELDSLETVYRAARTYCEAVFLTLNTPDIGIGSDKIAAIYRTYCRSHGISDFIEESMLNPYSGSSKESSSDLGWEEYLKIHKDDYLDRESNQGIYSLYHFSEIITIGINLMLDSQSVLRKCKLCGGYFRIKFSSSQECCTRMYKDTKAACNEYASRKSYKDKLFRHPIHQEFTKAYNKLYGRIRRGKVPADTPLMDQLKALHDEYADKYDNTHHKEREIVWKEYIEKNKKLLA